MQKEGMKSGCHLWEVGFFLLWSSPAARAAPGVGAHGREMLTSSNQLLRFLKAFGAEIAAPLRCSHYPGWHKADASPRGVEIKCKMLSFCRKRKKGSSFFPLTSFFFPLHCLAPSRQCSPLSVSISSPADVVPAEHRGHFVVPRGPPAQQCSQPQGQPGPATAQPGTKRGIEGHSGALSAR